MDALLYLWRKTITLHAVSSKGLGVLPVQVCLAYKGEGGRTIAVLSSRAKPDMEAVLKEALPIADRHGSTIVVRQGV